MLKELVLSKWLINSLKFVIVLFLALSQGQGGANSKGGVKPRVRHQPITAGAPLTPSGPRGAALETAPAL